MPTRHPGPIVLSPRVAPASRGSFRASRPERGWAVSGCGRMALQAGTLVFRRDAENDPRDAGATKPDDRLTAL